MAVSIDTVYQRVLALANKEQRGYITPQEFNTFANQAQLEIVEQYLYDINQFNRLNGNDTNYSDMIDLIEDKLSVLEEFVHQTVANGGVDGDGKTILPANLLKLGKVLQNNIAADQVTYQEAIHLTRPTGQLITPTSNTPIYTLIKNEIQLYGWTGECKYTYIRRPNIVSWGYIVISDKAMHDPNNTIDFELHSLEETELVYKILTLAGITLKRPDLSSTGAALLQTKVQQEKI